MEKIDEYNGDAEHNMLVDFDHPELERNRSFENLYSLQNTCESSVLFDEAKLDAYVDNLNDWD